MLFGRKNKNQPVEGRRPGASQPGRQNVFSYYASRSMPDVAVGRGEPRRESSSAHPFVRKLQNLPVILSVAVMVLACMYAFTLSTKPRVVLHDNSSAALSHTQDEYQQAAARAVSGSVFNRTKLTIDTVRIEDALRQQFPEIQAVEVTVPLLGHRPVVELSTIKPVFVLVNDTGEYFIAPDGRASSPISSYATKPANAVRLYDQSGLPLKPGKQILTKDTVGFINEVILQMQAKQVRISSLTMPAKPFEVQLRVEGSDYYVRFNTLGNARLQSGTYLALKQELESKKQKPAEYIDVRVEDRAFYK